MGKMAWLSMTEARGVRLTAMIVLLLMSASARADLRFVEPVADAGEVRAGVPLRHPFAFVNEGSQAVDIMSLRASCGCLRPSVAHRTWQPGE
jgi:hypothetical protein